MSFAIVAAACSPLQLPEESGAAPVTVTQPAPVAPAPSVSLATGLTPRSVALLLPLSGPQKAVAEAVRDGFLAAWFAAPETARPALTILDEERPGAADAYRAAVSAGASLVVGPLLKESVAQVAGIAGTVPTIALNYLDAGAASPEGFYQFALAPEDEAQQVAERALAEGRTRALALVPANDWGRRMLNAFTPALEAGGGKVLASRSYDPAATDFTSEIQRLLLIDESRARQRQLAANLGVSLEFEPRRRDDVDFIFLAANVGAGRLIRPQLRFLYAGDIPTYSTSAIYPSAARGDADLDGVMFADAPAILGSDSRAQELRDDLTRRWPAGAASRMRFYAMGFDACQLTTVLPGGARLAGLSGILTMDERRRIHRTLPWAEFRNGRIALLPDPQ